jgi:phage-related protein
MASYSYAGLEVRVTADTRGMASDIRAGATSAGQDAAKTISQHMTTGLKAVGQLFGSIGSAAVTGLGAASAAAIGFGVSAFQTAARVGEMDASLRALAKANNVSYDAMQQSVKAIRSQGIEAGTAQTLVAQFTRNQLKLSDATKLATVAQDAAVISGRNSTEVLGDLVHGITTQNSMVLRNAGLNVQAGQAVEAYAKSVGKASKELTDAERSQAVLNAVLESGKTVAGAYAEAMTEPGKVLRSFPRIIDDIKVSVGTGLVKALGPAILNLYDLAKAVSKAIEPGNVLSPVFDAIGVAVARLVAPVTAFIGGWSKLVAGLKPEQVARATEIIKQFGPALILAGAALATFTGAGVLGQLPIIGTLFGTLLAPLKLLGPTLLTVGKSAVGAIGGLTGTGTAAAGAGKGLAALLGPIGLVVAGIALLATVSPKFRAALVDVGKAVISAVMPALKALVAGVKQVLPPILDVARALGENLGPIISRLAPLLVPLGQLLGQVLAQSFTQLATALRLVAPVLIVVINVLGFLIDKVLAVVVPVARFAIGLISAASAAAAVVSPINALVAIFSAVASAIATVVRWIFGGSPGLIPAFVALAGVVGSIGGVLTGLVGIFRAMAAGIAAAWQAVTSSTRAAMSAVTSAATAGVNAVRSAVTSGFNAVRSAVASAMSATSAAVSSAFSSIRSAASSGASAVLSAVSSSFNQVRSVTQSAFSGIAGIVSSGLSAAVGAARAGGAAIVSGLQAGMNSAMGAVMSTISSIASKVSGALSSALKIGSPSRLTIPMGRDLFRGLEVGFAREEAVAEWATPNLHGGAGPSPLAGHPAGLGGLGTAGATINVYPQAGQDERAIAAMVSRELAWATAGGLLCHLLAGTSVVSSPPGGSTAKTRSPSRRRSASSRLRGMGSPSTRATRSRGSARWSRTSRAGPTRRPSTVTTRPARSPMAPRGGRRP